MCSSKRILFYPDMPHSRTVILKICEKLGYECSNSLLSDFLVGFKWRDTTVGVLDRNLSSISMQPKIFNLKCLDISKRNVSIVFAKTFGLEISVDPTTATELIVCKSDRNAAHDGVIMRAPLKKTDPTKVYQKLIDNSDGLDVIDLRVPIMLNHIPLVYVKRRPIADRFSNRNSSVSLSTPSALFSTQEISKLIAFCAEIGMEYGEIDLLRDQRDGQLFVVDANNTPYGPPNGLGINESAYALDLLGAGFEKTFLYPLTKSLV